MIIFKVVCRVRPLNQKEISTGAGLCFEIHDNQTISIKTSQVKNNYQNLNCILTQHYEIATGTQKFQFDRVFNLNSNQEEVYDFAAKPVVQSEFYHFYHLNKFLSFVYRYIRRF